MKRIINIVITILIFNAIFISTITLISWIKKWIYSILINFKIASTYNFKFKAICSIFFSISSSIPLIYKETRFIARFIIIRSFSLHPYSIRQFINIIVPCSFKRKMIRFQILIWFKIKQFPTTFFNNSKFFFC